MKMDIGFWPILWMTVVAVVIFSNVGYYMIFWATVHALLFLTGLVFPILIVLVGLGVFSYATGFFSQLTSLITGLG